MGEQRQMCGKKKPLRDRVKFYTLENVRDAVKGTKFGDDL